MKRIILSLIIAICSTSALLAGENSASAVTSLTKADFLKKVHNFSTTKKWKYLGKKPAIIDFNAVWCGPCRKLAPILADVAAKHPELVVYKVDVDEQPELADYFKVSSIPMVLYVPMTGAPKDVIGLQSKEEIEQMISTFLLKKK